MTTPELTSFVRKRLKKGYPAGELRSELLRQGYADQVIDEAFTPHRQWSDPTQGFGVQQLWAPAIFVLVVMARLGMQHFWQLGSGTTVTVVCIVFVYLCWRIGSPSGLPAAGK